MADWIFQWLTGSSRPARRSTAWTPASLTRRSGGGARPATWTGWRSAIGSGCRRRGRITRASTSGSTTASGRPCSGPSCSTTRRSGRSGRFIRIAAWGPWPSGRGGNAVSPPRKCQHHPIVCSHVPVPAQPHPRPGSGAAGPLRPRPVRLEPGRRAALPLAPGPEECPRLRGAVPAAHRRAGRAPVAGCWLPDGAAAGAAGLHPGHGRVLRPGQPGRAAVVAQGRPE
jgi:hypothetical protein